ncbi:tRNA (adenosine(37)-N6)-threonylcarbamoyltransferase complex transferase subunit TsaD [Ensifer sp. MPMI2T]|nr:tRNA (adenosine(37)-N6)-threonylcarbamoyltransferase complex transferase subunit TsaD [Ensifer sp. MPMI2T]
MSAPLRILGIETSCDETAASVVLREKDGSGRILGDVVLSQLEEHSAYGGVVPEIAARAHVEALDTLIEEALLRAGVKLADIDAVAATSGPGLIGGLIVGLMTGKAIARATGKPLYAVNHLEGHALTARLTDSLTFPYLMLLVSGGHTQLILVKGVGDYERWGTTIDDALGEAFDKTAKLLGLPYPGGPAVERMARTGDPKRFDFPRPLGGDARLDFSFSGLKTAVRQAAQSLEPVTEQDIADICASFQRAISRTLKDRVGRGLKRFTAEFAAVDQPAQDHDDLGLKSKIINVIDSSRSERDAGGKPLHTFPHPALVVAGGVAANQELRTTLQELCDQNGFRFVAPPLQLCTDNAAMIAWAGAERLAAGLAADGLDVAPRSRWPLDSQAQALIGSGKRGAKA